MIGVRNVSLVALVTILLIAVLSVSAVTVSGSIKVCSGDQHFIFLKNRELESQGIHATYSTEIGSDGDWVWCLTY